jgi:hypothetical protein
MSLPTSTSNLFAKALQAYRELQPELEQAGRAIQAPALPTLNDVAGHLDVPPRGALMLGVAADGLPVLLDLSDLAPFPMLVMGDRGSGKTALLQLLARSVDLLQEPGDIQFGVVTNFPEEWEGVAASASSLGVWPAYHRSAEQFVHDMVAGTGGGRSARQMQVLLFDDLAALVSANAGMQEDLRRLLALDPEQRVLTVATLNAVRALRLRPWLESFPMHIFGFIHQPALAETLTGDPQAGLAYLTPGQQFSFQQDSGWLQFWLPSLE